MSLTKTNKYYLSDYTANCIY